MAKKSTSFIIGVIVIAAIVGLVMLPDRNLLQAFQPGETIVLDCHSEEECRQQLIVDGAPPSEAEKIDFSCTSGGVCTSKQVAGNL